MVYNDVGYTSGDVVTAVTMAGVPLKPPTFSAHAINHTAVQVNWIKPCKITLSVDNILSQTHTLTHTAQVQQMSSPTDLC